MIPRFNALLAAFAIGLIINALDFATTCYGIIIRHGNEANSVAVGLAADLHIPLLDGLLILKVCYGLQMLGFYYWAYSSKEPWLTYMVIIEFIGLSMWLGVIDGANMGFWPQI